MSNQKLSNLGNTACNRIIVNKMFLSVSILFMVFLQSIFVLKSLEAKKYSDISLALEFNSKDRSYSFQRCDRFVVSGVYHLRQVSGNILKLKLLKQRRSFIF